MSIEHTEGLDLNLLVLFHHVWTERSVSRAADRLGMTQSAVSHGLAKLRVLFGDQLFVRAGGAMLPTPRAEALAIPVHEVIERLQRDILPNTRFDAATAQRRFTIALSDLGEIVSLPNLLREFAARAPRCQLHSRRLPNGEIERALEDGSLELALGNVFEPKRNCFQQTLYTHDYRVIAWDRHPRLGKRLSLAQYQQEQHLVADTGSDEHLRLHGLQPNGVQRQAVAWVGGLLALPWLLPETPLLATVPSHLARVACGRFPLRQFPLPLEVPPYAIKTHWHARMHNDAGHRWLRETVYELLRHYPQWQWAADGPLPPLGPRRP